MEQPTAANLRQIQRSQEVRNNRVEQPTAANPQQIQRSQEARNTTPPAVSPSQIQNGRSRGQELRNMGVMERPTAANLRQIRNEIFRDIMMALDANGMLLLTSYNS